MPVPVYFLRIVLAAGAGLLFPVALRRRTAVTDWLVGGVAVLFPLLAEASTPHALNVALRTLHSAVARDASNLAEFERAQPYFYFTRRRLKPITDVQQIR